MVAVLASLIDYGHKELLSAVRKVAAIAGWCSAPLCNATWQHEVTVQLVSLAPFAGTSWKDCQDGATSAGL